MASTRLAFAVLAAFGAAYALAFAVYCWRDDAPRPWDESFFLYHPTAVLRALHDGGFGSALRAFWETGYHKPPLSSFGTLPAMLLFGDGSIAYRADNLVVALGAMALAYALLRGAMAPVLAAVLAIGVLLAPYAMLFARIEMAELYLWASTLLYLLLLGRCDAFRARRATLLLGVALGLGMLSKTSFPLVVGPPTAWMLGAALLRDGRLGLSRRLGNALGAGAIGAVLFVPFYARNWKLIRHHFENQFGWLAQEYSIGDPWTLVRFERYFDTWCRWYGELWLWLGGLAIGLALVCVVVGRGRQLLAGWPAGALAAGAITNLAYCYFHPVADPRFACGAMSMLQLATAWLLARALAALGADRPATALVLLAPCLCFLLANSHRPDGTRVLDIDWPAVGTARHVLFPPVHGEDLAPEVLAHSPLGPGEPLWIALAGDHMRFSNDTIRLVMRKRGIPGEVIQLGYFGPEPTMRERFLRSRQAVLWAVVLDSGSGRESSWAQRYAPDALALLRANPDLFAPLPWRGELPDGVEVLLFSRTAAFDDSSLRDAPRAPSTPASGR